MAITAVHLIYTPAPGSTKEQAIGQAALLGPTSGKVIIAAIEHDDGSMQALVAPRYVKPEPFSLSLSFDGVRWAWEETNSEGTGSCEPVHAETALLLLLALLRTQGVGDFVIVNTTTGGVLS